MPQFPGHDQRGKVSLSENIGRGEVSEGVSLSEKLSAAHIVWHAESELLIVEAHQALAWPRGRKA
jgi:hypothetical protein